MPKEKTKTLPMLFTKRRPLSAAVAAQYHGTDSEMDPKESITVKPGVA